MGDVFKLNDAILEVFSKAVTGDISQWKPLMPTKDDPNTKENERKTYCNFSVREVCEKMGYTGFAGMMANQIVQKMQKSEKWFAVPVDEAQGYANNGNVVIAGIIDSPHGHVAVVRPGKEKYSDKWKKAVPMVMNVGATNFIDHHIGFAFKTEPQVFVWKGNDEGTL